MVTRSAQKAKRATSRARPKAVASPTPGSDRDTREQIAYELHDGVCQELVAITLLLSPVLGKARRVAPTLSADLEYVSQRVAHTLEAARALAQDWAGPSADCGSNLQDALEAEASAVRADHEVDIDVDASAVARWPLDSEVVEQLRKVAREAMRNAVRHGSARRVGLRLRDVGARWQLEICNDGQAPLIAMNRCGALGIRGMRHRAEQLEGTLQIRRRIPHGLRIIVCWPKVRTSDPVSRQRP
jgi:signal transduction histidine kinase